VVLGNINISIEFISPEMYNSEVAYLQ